MDHLSFYIADNRRYDGRMEYHRCGRSGLKLPAVSLGLWHNFGSNGNFDNMRAMICTAFDSGITHFDLANNYGPEYGSAEENFGRIFQKNLKCYRDEIIVSTKAGYDMWEGPYGNGGSRKYLIASLDRSLQRMGLDYVDIFYHHRPDLETPPDETADALAAIVSSGKALYIGISNYNREQTEEMARLLQERRVPLILNQRRYSMFARDIEKEGTKKWCADNGIGIIGFCPLAQGLLTGKYLNGIPDDSRMRTDGRFLHESDLTEEKLRKIRALAQIAEMRGQSLAQMALSWDLRDSSVTSVIIGASRSAQITENVKIIGHTSFHDDEIEAIDKILDES